MENDDANGLATSTLPSSFCPSVGEGEGLRDWRKSDVSMSFHESGGTYTLGGELRAFVSLHLKTKVCGIITNVRVGPIPTITNVHVGPSPTMSQFQSLSDNVLTGRSGD